MFIIFCWLRASSFLEANFIFLVRISPTSHQSQATSNQQLAQNTQHPSRSDQQGATTSMHIANSKQQTTNSKKQQQQQQQEEQQLQPSSGYIYTLSKFSKNSKCKLSGPGNITYIPEHEANHNCLMGNRWTSHISQNWN